MKSKFAITVGEDYRTGQIFDTHKEAIKEAIDVLNETSEGEVYEDLTGTDWRVEKIFSEGLAKAIEEEREERYISRYKLHNSLSSRLLDLDYFEKDGKKVFYLYSDSHFSREELEQIEKLGLFKQMMQDTGDGVRITDHTRINNYGDVVFKDGLDVSEDDHIRFDNIYSTLTSLTVNDFAKMTREDLDQ